jgi:hypothetical protein
MNQLSPANEYSFVPNVSPRKRKQPEPIVDNIWEKGNAEVDMHTKVTATVKGHCNYCQEEKHRKRLKYNSRQHGKTGSFCINCNMYIHKKCWEKHHQ